MNRATFLTLTAALAWLCIAPAAPAGELTEMDGLTNIRLLDTHFVRFGYMPLKTIRLQDKGIEFRLPGRVKDISQTGMYSYVALAGDFEVEASYEWDEIPEVADGYGMSCGLAVDTFGPDGQVQLARVFSKGGRTGYNVVWGKPDPMTGKVEYPEIKFVKSKAKLGGLALRREKDVLICLAADGQGELKELHRVEPFSEATIRQFRIYADPGGSPTPLHVWMGQIRVKAEEITGSFAKGEVPKETRWWPYIVTGSLAVGAAGLYLRWRRQRRPLLPGERGTKAKPARPFAK